MANVREIITLQFGHYSNYVGSHFWNIEELSFDYTGTKKTEIQHDILYREGLTIDGKVTYTPRLLLADLKYSLKSLPEQGGLEVENTEDLTDWDKTEIIKETPQEKSDYQKHVDSNLTEPLNEIDLSSKVGTWTDYLYPRFHHRTINIVNSYCHNDEKVPFETFSAGRNVWKGDDFAEVFCDNIRHYAEECDSFQGFCMILDSTDSFGGLASGCLDHLSDQYSNKSIFALPLIPCFPDGTFQKELLHLCNVALTYEQLFEYSSLFVPLSCRNGLKNLSTPRKFCNVQYDTNSHYESSAILASALDTISLKYLHKDLQLHLSDLCADMSGYGRKMAAMSMGLPFYMRANDYLINHLNNVDDPLWTSLTPNCEISSDKVFQHIVVRGIPETRLKRPPETAKEQLKLAAYKCGSVREMFEFYFQCNCFISASNVSVSNSGMEVKTPFPRIFTKSLNTDGFVKEFEDSTYPSQVPVIAGLHNGNFLFNTLERLHREASRIKQSKLQKFFDNGLEKDDFTNALEKINEAMSNYHDDFEL